MPIQKKEVWTLVWVVVMWNMKGWNEENVYFYSHQNKHYSFIKKNIIPYVETYQYGFSGTNHPRVTFILHMRVFHITGIMRQYLNIIKKQLLLPLFFFKVDFWKFYFFISIWNYFINGVLNIIIFSWKMAITFARPDS